jgi:hypothetical protein
MLPKWLIAAFAIGSFCAACANGKAIEKARSLGYRNATPAEHQQIIADYCAKHQEDWCFENYRPFQNTYVISSDASGGSGASSGC